MSDLEWVKDQLHAVLGMSDRDAGEFLLSMAKKSADTDDLLERIRDTDTLDTNSTAVSFTGGDNRARVQHREPSFEHRHIPVVLRFYSEACRNSHSFVSILQFQD